MNDREQKEDTTSLNVIVLDGTWNQARCLDRRFPSEIPRYNTSFCFFSLQMRDLDWKIFVIVSDCQLREFHSLISEDKLVKEK
jgi:hypothetical protein